VAGKTDGKKVMLAQSEALDVLWAQSIEEHTGAFSAKELSEAAHQARQELGEGAGFAAFLVRRSEKIARLFPKKRPQVPLLESGVRAGRLSVLAFCAVLFLLGAFTEKLTNTGAEINLLSPPILLLAAWNAAVYLAVLLSPLLRGRGLPLVPSFIGRLLEHRMLRKYTDSTSAEFFKSAFLRTRSVFAWRGSALFHLGAAFFAIGLAAGMVFEGLVTNFSAGWESTWLFNRPHWVALFLKVFYGSVPFGQSLIAQITPESVIAMRFGAGYEAVSAAPWMMQLIAILLCWIAVPRLLLAFYAHCRAKRAAGNISLDFEQGFYRKLFQQWQGQRMSIQIFPFATGVAEADREVLKVLSEKDEAPQKIEYFPTFNEDNPLPEIPVGAQNEVWAVFSLGATPEGDVQGAFLADVIAACRAKQCGVRAVVLSSAFEERFSDLPQRILTRKNTWKTFLDSYRIPYAVAGVRAVDFSKW
jgi:hypothetical protein